MFAAILESA